ncbi:MAG: hypothetical protein J6Y31_01355 [Bacteroidales bacterium]|nr:hypothetical protein [Bacteroidales bacterium]
MENQVMGEGGVLPDYAVGGIPIQEGVSPTGARTYTIPIPASGSSKMAPSIALQYNSQGGEGAEGYGWSIGGLSAISITGQNKFYHAAVKAPDVQDTLACYSLDGVPLVSAEIMNLRVDYPLSTAHGHVHVKKHVGQSGLADHFSALYPDGRKAVFGTPGASGSGAAFPLTRMEDSYGHAYEVSYLDGGNVYDPSEIRYNFTSEGTPESRIQFSYTYSADSTRARYYAGVAVKRQRRLNAIRCYERDTLTAEYLLSYEQHGEAVSQIHVLKEVRLRSCGEEVPPLRFGYAGMEAPVQAGQGGLGGGVPALVIQDFIQDDTLRLSSSFKKGSPIRLIRGRFCKGTFFSDGLVLMPDFPNYSVLRFNKSNGDASFGSLYSPNQLFLWAPVLADSSKVLTITAGEGFQTLEAIDVDNDGTDELVKVNFNGISNSKTQLLLTIYSYDVEREVLDALTFTALVGSTFRSGNEVSPARLAYYWGRFKDDGHPQLMTITYDRNPDGSEPAYNYASFIDLQTQSRLMNNAIPWAVSSGSEYRILVYDMDSDGVTDICRSTSSGLERYRMNDWHNLELVQTYSEPSSLSSHYTIADMNADGYPDIVEYPRSGRTETFVNEADPDNPQGWHEEFVPGPVNWKTYYYNGASFTRREWNFINWDEELESLSVMDVNHDGYADVLRLRKDRAPNVYINEGGTLDSLRVITAAGGPQVIGSDILPANIMTSGAASQLIVLDEFKIKPYRFSEDRSLDRLLTEVRDSYGREYYSRYVSALDWPIYQEDGERSYSLESGYYRMALPLNVLSYSSSELPDSTALSNMGYSYFDAVCHNGGLGFTGFGSVRAADYISGRVSRSYYDPEKFGVPTGEALFLEGDPLPYARTTGTYTTVSGPHGSWNPLPAEQTADDYLGGVRTTTTLTYDNLGFPVKETTRSSLLREPADTTLFHDALVTTSRTYSHRTFTTNFNLGVVLEESTVSERDGSDTLSWKERTTYTYDAHAKPLTATHYVGKYGTVPDVPQSAGDQGGSPEEGEMPGGSNEGGEVPFDPGLPPIDPGIIEPGILTPEDPSIPSPGEPAVPSPDDTTTVIIPIPDPTVIIEDPVNPPVFPDYPWTPEQPVTDSSLVHDPELAVIHYDATYLEGTRRWTYDTHGNVTREESAPYGTGVFTGESYSYDTSGRRLLSATDALGHSTMYSRYSVYGKPGRATDYKGRSSLSEYDVWGRTIRTVGADSVASAVVRVWCTGAGWPARASFAERTVTDGAPEQETVYDAAGRKLREGVRRFDGSWQYVLTEYDSEGRVARTSLPFKDGVSSADTLWSENSYDPYGRLVQTSHPGGRVDSLFYNWNAVTSVTAGLTSTKVTDASGQTVMVTDAGGTVTYALRDDGQPSVITAPGGVQTSFAYDDYGRRIRVDDPSLGAVTDEYVWDSAGALHQTHTNPYGSVVTVTDRYGRTVSEQRPGLFDTQYVYDADGLLTSVSSTNGTSTVYSYDSLDRPVSVTDTVPDGKWLRKVMAYDGHGRTSSVSFTSDRGYITTETYGYSNGYQVETLLPDSTVVWRLTGENALGQPTSGVSGATLRTYGYGPTGLPTYRKIESTVNLVGGNVPQTGTEITLDDGSTAILYPPSVEGPDIVQMPLQEYSYNFDPITGNLLSRTDNMNLSPGAGGLETFTYDSQHRLVSFTGKGVQYDGKSNIVSIDGVGTMAYNNTERPYELTSFTEEGYIPGGAIQLHGVSIPQVQYNALLRPDVVSRELKEARFVYDAEGRRVRMQVYERDIIQRTRYYIGGRYEIELPGNTIGEQPTEVLYLGGDAYSAPMAMYRAWPDTAWTCYSIGRDNLGSITEIISDDGYDVAKYSYDPWGRRRNPQTQQCYSNATLAQQMPLLLGRGFTGHEHIDELGLINMNARLYDPLYGRFLAPDPFVQAPDITQNFNRYIYCLNNPLRYTDESGEFFVIDSFLIGLIGGGWERAKQMAWNDIKIWGGLFVVDKNKGFFEGTWELLSRFIWQTPQTVIGFLFSHAANTFRISGGVLDVDYLHGATVLRMDENKNEWGGITFGSYIVGNEDIRASDDDRWFQHEFGHYLQSQEHGGLWLFTYAIESGISAAVNDNDSHNAFYTEQDANARSYLYLAQHYGFDYAYQKWDTINNPIHGYIQSKSYSQNMSFLESLIFRLRYGYTTYQDLPNYMWGITNLLILINKNTVK